MGFGQYAVFIIASYAATLLVVAALIGWLILAGRHWQGELARLEARGVRRRSQSREGDERA